MHKKVIVIGSGGHAKVVIDILNLMSNIEIIGITSKSLHKGTEFFNYTVLGDDTILNEFVLDNEVYVAMGLGGFRDNNLRKQVYNYCKNLGLSFVNVIHPSAIISNTAKIGEGVVIFPGVVINTDVTIGNNVIIATNSSIDHETIISDHVLISAGAIIGAYTKIDDGALIALGANVVSGIIIGSNSLVAAGAVVINNVEAEESVYGIPAKVKIQ